MTPRHNKRASMVLNRKAAWLLFFRAIQSDGGKSYQELIGIAAGAGGWVTFYNGESGPEPPRRGVVVVGDVPPEVEVEDQTPGWRLTFRGSRGQAPAFTSTTARVIEWEVRHNLVDEAKRPHPLGFTCAMNIIGAEHGNTSARLQLSPPTRTKALTVYQALSEPFTALIRVPRFSPMTESWGAFRNRVRHAADRAVTESRHKNDPETTPPTFPKRSSRHFEWLVRYQVSGESRVRIRDTSEQIVDQATVNEALRVTAKILGLRLREGEKGGRPRKPKG